MSLSLQHASACRPQRCLQLPCRAEQGCSGPSHRQHEPIAGRRSVLQAAVLLPAAAGWTAAAARPANADEAAPATLGAATTQPTTSTDISSWPQWIDRTFTFSYPPGFKEVADLSYAMPPKPRGNADQVVENPLKAEVRSGDEQQRINVVVRQATALKRTLLQVTDISQLGDPRAVARLLLPPGAAVAASAVTSVAQPPRDTGTVLGVIQRDPVNYYSYEVLLPDQTRVALAAAAQLGRVYVVAAGAPEGDWAAAGPALKQAAASFRLKYKTS